MSAPDALKLFQDFPLSPEVADSGELNSPNSAPRGTKQKWNWDLDASTQKKISSPVYLGLTNLEDPHNKEAPSGLP